MCEGAKKLKTAVDYYDASWTWLCKTAEEGHGKYFPKP